MNRSVGVPGAHASAAQFQAPTGGELMGYLDNAPPALIKLYEKRSELTGQFVHKAIRPRLGKLLSDGKMKRAWNAIEKSIKTQKDYNAFLEAIIEAMRLARRGIVSQTDRRERYERIARCAEHLVTLIATPDRPPRDGSGYRGELDLYAYQFSPGALSWETMTSDDRAYSFTMVECLNELAGKAEDKAKEHVPSRRRSRRELNEETVDEITTKTKARLFSCYLDDELRKLNSKLGGTATIRAIASVVYELDLDSEMLKKALLDHRKKRWLHTEIANSTPSQTTTPSADELQRTQRLADNVTPKGVGGKPSGTQTEEEGLEAGFKG